MLRWRYAEPTVIALLASPIGELIILALLVGVVTMILNLKDPTGP